MSLFQLLNTVRHLKFRQVAGRIIFKFKHPKPDKSPAPPLSPLLAKWIDPAKRDPSQIEPLLFRFLNKEGRLTSAESWNDPQAEKLWLYNLHYFDDLNAHGNNERAGWHQKLIKRWIDENPPAYKIGWEPYPISIRIVNWIKWALSGAQTGEAFDNSLAVQARYLRQKLETHLLGNHLFANAKALVFAGCYFDGDEAVEWLKKGEKILDKELHRQVLPDGGHFELSPMYHCIVLEDILDLINIRRAYGKEYNGSFEGTAGKMLEWLHVMTHPDGNIALFNDAAFNIAPGVDQLDQYADRLNVGFEKADHKGLITLPQTGYSRMSKGSVVVFADAASVGPDYLPAHGHADTLTFEMSCNGKRVVVNSGTSLYEPGRERLRQRGTSAHNTIAIDSLDSSEVWSSFRVASRAYIQEFIADEDKSLICVSAAHDGYKRLGGVGLHKRTWQLRDDSLKIIDIVEGGSTKTVEIGFHFHPDLSIEKENSNTIVIGDIEKEFIIRLFMDSALHVELKKSSYHPEFGKAIDNIKVVGTVTASLPVELETVFVFEGI